MVEEANQAVAAKDFPKAVRLYEASLDGTPKTAEIHYRLAILYDNNLKDPVSAIHHYRRFLKMSEGSRKTEEINRSVERLQREMAARLGEGGLVSRQEAVRLRNENNELRKQVAELKAHRDSLKKEAEQAAKAAKNKPPVDKKGFSKVPQTREAERAVGAETKTYTVRKGDTLASISRKFYNSPARWKDIADANFNQLGGSTNLREGQVLIIP